MWFDQVKFNLLEQASANNRNDDIQEILTQLGSIKKNANPYTFCPKCGKAFVNTFFRSIKIALPSCPDQHGVWIDEQNSIRILSCFQNGKRIQRPEETQRILGVLVWIIIMFSFGIMMALEKREKKMYSQKNNKMTYSMKHTKIVGQNYWPTRDFSQWNAFPANQNVITDPEELEYFQQWIVLINAGILNRLNMNDALLAQRPGQEYVDVYYYFADKQNNIIHLLRDLYPPDKLLVFHNLVIEASINQIDFYDDYARQKSMNPSLGFQNLLDHPKLKTCDQKLWAAYFEFQRIYPNRDMATNNAIEQRLCWMDLI